jgi:alanyl aminopeptidase
VSMKRNPWARVAGASSTLLLLLGLVAVGHAEEDPGFRLSGDAVPRHYRVRLRLDPDSPTFGGSVAVDLDIRRTLSTVWLHAADLNLTRATVSTGKRTEAPAAIVQGAHGLVGFRTREPLRAGRARLRVDYEGRLGESPEGLFRVKDGSRAYIHALLEPSHARRAVPCFDEPAMLATWRLEVETPAGNVVLSNAPERARSRTASGSELVAFAPTPPIPPYLLGLAVGPFESTPPVAAGRRKVPLRLWTPSGRTAQAEFARTAAPMILDRLESYLAAPYPYEKLDLIAAPIGVAAAESPGLIRFRERLMLASPAEDTESRRRGFVDSCAHEIAHMWFGGLVPIRWWSDVWIKESLASWAGAKITREWDPPLTTPLGDAMFRLNALRKDTAASAKPLQREVASEADIKGLYGSLAYEKGPLVIQMIEDFVGETRFRSALRRLVSSHAGRPAGLAELEAALRSGRDARGREAAEVLGRYAVEPGVPLLALKLDCSPPAAKLVLSLRRLGRPDLEETRSGRWVVPFCAAFGDRQDYGRKCVLVRGEAPEMELAARKCPTWVLPNDTAAGYYVADFDPDLLRGLPQSVSATLPPRSLASLLSDRRALLPGGTGSLKGALDLVRSLGPDPDPDVALAAVELTREVSRFVSDQLRDGFRDFVGRRFGPWAERAIANHLGGDSGPGVVLCSSCDAKRLAPALMAFVADEGAHPGVIDIARNLTAKWLQDPESVPSDLAPVALRVAARFGERAAYAPLAAAFATARGERRQWLLDAMASVPDADSVRATLARPDLSGNELLRALQLAARDPTSGAVVLDVLKADYDGVVRRLPAGAEARLPGLFAGSCQRGLVSGLESLFASRLPGVGQDGLQRAVAEIQRCAELRERNAAGARTLPGEP